MPPDSLLVGDRRARARVRSHAAVIKARRHPPHCIRAATMGASRCCPKPLFLLHVASGAAACSCQDMDPHKRRWRFFTQLIEEDGAAAHLWCWAKVDAEDRVV